MIVRFAFSTLEKEDRDGQDASNETRTASRRIFAYEGLVFTRRTNEMRPLNVVERATASL